LSFTGRKVKKGVIPKKEDRSRIETKFQKTQQRKENCSGNNPTKYLLSPQWEWIEVRGDMT
jgi:hypothetical protein